MAVAYGFIHWKKVNEDDYESGHGAQVLKKQLKKHLERGESEGVEIETRPNVSSAKVSPEVDDGGEDEENNDEDKNDALKVEVERLQAEIVELKQKRE